MTSGFRARWDAIGLAVVLAAAAACGGGTPVSPTARSPQDPVLVGAGDIARCDQLEGAYATATLLDSLGGTIFTAGDNVQTSGTAAEYAQCYAPTWGRHRARIRPSPGNHDYVTASGAEYFAYFGEAAGPPGTGYYSYDLGAWHIVSLNSNAPAGSGSAQEQWLRADLQAHPSACTLAYWHHPMFTSGSHADDPRMTAIWRVLYDFHADVVVNGHNHIYERFAPQAPDGRADPAGGIREFIVGTGGAPLTTVRSPRPNSEVASDTAWGVLRLTLHPDGYDWEFVPVAGRSFRDAGTSACVP